MNLIKKKIVNVINIEVKKKKKEYNEAAIKAFMR